MQFSNALVMDRPSADDPLQPKSRFGCFPPGYGGFVREIGVGQRMVSLGKVRTDRRGSSDRLSPYLPAFGVVRQLVHKTESGDCEVQRPIPDITSKTRHVMPPSAHRLQ